MDPEQRLKLIEEAWFDYAFADASAETPNQHIEVAEEFARRVGDAVFGGITLDGQADSLGIMSQDASGRTVLIVNMPHTKECAACGMDDSMEGDLELCSTCGGCVWWEDEFGAGSCCTCPKTVGQS